VKHLRGKLRNKLSPQIRKSVYSQVRRKYWLLISRAIDDAAWTIPDQIEIETCLEHLYHSYWRLSDEEKNVPTC
jgi:hypothetical protein